MSWPANVERWRSRVQQFAPLDHPVEFHLAWIRFESGGDPMSTGASTEVGIYQVDLQDGPKYGGTVATLHRSFASLDEAGKDLQVKTGVAMLRDFVSRSHARLVEVSSRWPDDSADLWAMVKWHHNLPGYTRSLLADFRNAHGRGPATFLEWATWVNNGPKPSYVDAKYWGPDGKWSRGAKGLSAFTENARMVGSYAGGFLSRAGELVASLGGPAAAVAAGVIRGGR